jgi:hypothetical protein
MSEDKLQFLNRMMNDPGMRQRLRNAQERRRECERLWDEKTGGSEEREVTPEPEPEPEVEAAPVAENDEAEAEDSEDDQAEPDEEDDD